MEVPDKELEKAKILDQIVNLLAPYYVAGMPSERIYLGTVEIMYGVDNVVLRRYLTEESRWFDITAMYDAAMGRKEGTIHLTEDGQYQLKQSGPWFVKRLEAERELAQLDQQKEILQREREKIQKEIKVEEERLKNKRARREKIALKIIAGIGWAILAVIGFWEAFGSNNSKLHEQKEAQWESERGRLQSQIEELTKKYNMIPDSIRQRYE